MNKNQKNVSGPLKYEEVAKTKFATKVEGKTPQGVEFSIWIPIRIENKKEFIENRIQEILASPKLPLVVETDKAVKVVYENEQIWLPKSIFEICPYLSESAEHYILKNKFEEIEIGLAEKETDKAIKIEGIWYPKSKIVKGKYVPKWLFELKHHKPTEVN